MGTPPGLQTDCEALLSRFQETDSVRFEDFTELWRNMKFGTIFCGKMRNLEKNTFTKEALALAWRYFLPPYTFQIRVGALYLLYGLYNTQLCQPKQKIRVALKDWDEVLKFQQDLINAQHFDAAYIFRKLRLDKAFHFTAMPKLLSYRMKKKIQRAEVTEEFKDPDDRVMKLITSDVLEEMLNVHDHYQNMKHIISADKSKPDKALSLIKDDFLDNIKNIVLEHQQWHKDRKDPSLKSKNKDGEEKKEEKSQESEVRQLPYYCLWGSSLISFFYFCVAIILYIEHYGLWSFTGNVKNVHKEEKSLSLSMPVITEEEEETEDFSETEFTVPKRKRKH
ncbi:small nuclear RNA activating complex polypeptide 1 [Ictidomys tridecemlineatus]|nr:small nuclear RNA activating complex polypeptide 1 [Ictidomys tridecemlineatus]